MRTQSSVVMGGGVIYSFSLHLLSLLLSLFSSQGQARLRGYNFRITECWSCVAHISVFSFLRFQEHTDLPLSFWNRISKQARGTPDAVTPKKKKRRKEEKKKKKEKKNAHFKPPPPSPNNNPPHLHRLRRLLRLQHIRLHGRAPLLLTMHTRRQSPLQHLQQHGRPLAIFLLAPHPRRRQQLHPQRHHGARTRRSVPQFRGRRVWFGTVEFRERLGEWGVCGE